jgi:thiol-disulfide isomerase/thioredoxin
MIMRVILSITPLALVSFLAAAPSVSVRQGPIPIDTSAHGVGRWVPDLFFTTIDGKKGKLSDFKDKKALVVAFTGASCPISKRFAPSLAELEKEYAKKDVVFVFVDPIAVEGAKEDLRKMANEQGFKGPVILDEDESLARGLGANTTTDTFVLDAARTVLYRGPVDDQYGIGYQLDGPRRRYLREALDAHLANKPIKSRALWAPGCELDIEKNDSPKQDLTYHNRISRILEANCVECHREGGVGPFPLEHYDEAEENAGMIRKVVSEGIMPPWFASAPPKGHPSPWANDRSLPPSDRADLLTWIKNGKPEGNPADAPLPIVRKSEWRIGQPDAVFSLPREVQVKATGQMPYVYLRVKTNFSEDRWVEAAEVRPTSAQVVHHVIVFVTGPAKFNRDQTGSLAVYVPGNTFVQFPPGVAKKLPAGATLLFQMHYTPTGKATSDRTRIGLRFAKEHPAKIVRTLPVANRRIRIPANESNHVETASRYIPPGTVVRAFMPHMHLRGKAFKYELLNKSGDRETLLEVPHYDFNWQLRYELKEPRVLPEGSRIEVTGTFDNSLNNLANPDPNRTVHWGDQSDEEMLIGYVECEFDAKESVKKNIRGGADLFVQLDKNKDGFLTKEEFTRPALFPLFDANKDGRVTRGEGTEGMARLKKREEELRKGREALRGVLDRFR